MVTRRKFIQSTAALAGTAMLGPTARTWAAQDALNILCWNGYDGKDLLDPFQKMHKGIKINTQDATSDPAMINKLRAGGVKIWDFINVNQPWAQGVLYPEKLINPLDKDRYEKYFSTYLPQFQNYSYSYDDSGQNLLGLPQRFGPFSFVVNTKKISRKTAEDEGWNLFFDEKMKNRYGVLTYPNWNLMHLCLAAGLDPWEELDDAALQKFRKTATYIFSNARMRSAEAASLNLNLINGTIDAYFTGGTWTASPPRYDGFDNIRAITPKSGPVNGRGGIVWVEVNSLVNNPNRNPAAADFLEYIQQPEAAKKVAFVPGTYNPVANMGDPDCFKLFNKKELKTIQWDSLDEELSRCVDHGILGSHDKLQTIYDSARRS